MVVGGCKVTVSHETAHKRGLASIDDNRNCMEFINDCNSTTWNLAIAHQQEQQEWRSQGWYIIPPDETVTMCWDGFQYPWIYLHRSIDESSCHLGQSQVRPREFDRFGSFCINGGNRFNIKGDTSDQYGKQVWANFTEQVGEANANETCHGLGSLCYFMANFYEIDKQDQFILSTCGEGN